MIKSAIKNSRVDWLCLVGSLSLMYACSSHPDDDNFTTNAEGIVNGSYTTGYSGVVMLATHGTDMPRPSGYCSGTLISDRVVLTAAHCLYNKGFSLGMNNAGPWTLVGFGSKHTRTPDGADTMVWINISRVAIHPAYNERPIKNDVALIELAESAPASAQRHSLFTSPPTEGLPITMVGFGLDAEQAWDSFGWKRVGTSQIMSGGFYPSFKRDYFGSRHQPSNICSGDSGGPAFVGSNLAVAGIASHGMGECGDETAYRYHCRVDLHYHNFIKPFLDGRSIDGYTYESFPYNWQSSATTLITHYYVSILERQPEPEGLSYWLGRVVDRQVQGLDVKPVFRDIANHFFNSSEYLSRNTTNQQFINNLYLTFFQRNSDEGGYAYWTGQLNSGQSRQQVMMSFLHSQEFTSFMQSLGF